MSCGWGLYEKQPVFSKQSLFLVPRFAVGILEPSRNYCTARDAAARSFHSHMVGIINHSLSIRLVSHAVPHLLKYVVTHTHSKSLCVEM